MRTQSVHHLLDHISNYLDNQLTEQEERQFLVELKTNPQYKQLLQQESGFRDLIKTKLQRRTASPVLLTSIKEKIRVQAINAFNHPAAASDADVLKHS